MEKVNLYKVLNDFNHNFKKDAKYQFDFATEGHIFIEMIYNENVDIPSCAWNCTSHEPENSIIKNAKNYGMAKIWVHRNEKTQEVEFTLWKDNGIYMNPYTMPDYEMAQQFSAAAEEMASCRADFCIGRFQVDMSEKILLQAIDYVEGEIKNIVKEIERYNKKDILKMVSKFSNLNRTKSLNRLTSNLAKETELLNMLTEALYKKRKDFQTTALDLCITE